MSRVVASLIIINGAPATGKTTLLQTVAPQLGLPAIGKDDIKEFLFDTLGHSNRDWSRLLGRSSTEMLYLLAKEFLAVGQTIIIENAFWPEFAAPELKKLAAQHNAKVLEIYCSADEETRMQRFRDRHDNGQRHPGHVDNLATLRDVTGYMPLCIGDLIEVDLTRPTPTVYSKVQNQIQNFVNPKESNV